MDRDAAEREALTDDHQDMHNQLTLYASRPNSVVSEDESGDEGGGASLSPYLRPSEALKEAYSDRNTATIHTFISLTRAVSNCDISKHENLGEYGKDFIMTRDRLTELGQPLPAIFLLCSFLEGLDESFQSWKDEFIRRGFTVDVTDSGVTSSKMIVPEVEEVLKELMDRVEQMDQSADERSSPQSVAEGKQMVRQGDHQIAEPSSAQKQTPSELKSREDDAIQSEVTGPIQQGRPQMPVLSSAHTPYHYTRPYAPKCTHCFGFHLANRCFFLHPELAPNVWRARYPTAQSRRTGLRRSRWRNAGHDQNDAPNIHESMTMTTRGASTIDLAVVIQNQFFTRSLPAVHHAPEIPGNVISWPMLHSKGITFVIRSDNTLLLIDERSMVLFEMRWLVDAYVLVQPSNHTSLVTVPA